jgi:hypothetical protein
VTADLVVRLLAAIDERERRANAEGHYDPDEGGYYACPATRSEPYGDLPFGEDACDCGLAKRRAEALRLCQSHRDIVARFKWAWDRRNTGTPDEVAFRQTYVIAMVDVLADLAKGYGVESSAPQPEVMVFTGTPSKETTDDE